MSGSGDGNDGSGGLAMLQDYLAERDEACPRCGYNLRGLTGETCPECGAALRLRVGLVEQRIAAYVFWVAVNAMGLGAVVLLGVIALLSGKLDWFWTETSGVLSLLLFVVTLSQAFAAFFFRRWFMRLASMGQWLVVWVCACFVLTVFVLVFALID